MNINLDSASSIKATVLSFGQVNAALCEKQSAWFDMKVIFSHGKESGPWGSKIKRLANTAKKAGYEVESIDYSGIVEPDLRAEHLEFFLNNTKDDFVLVGSSMGGYVSLVASEQVIAKGIFLLAPALYMPGYNKKNYDNRAYVEIVHGWSDDIIPPENSIRFAKSNNSALHLIAGDHRLNSSIEVVDKLFSQFLDSITHNKALQRTSR